MDIYYYDDPVDEPVVKQKKPKAIFGAALLLFAGGLSLNTTLAANVSLNSGVKIEFGQGVQTTTACSGATILTVTPTSTFINVSGGGSFYFSSVSVANIPASCHGKDFTISAYNSSSSNPLPIFNTNATKAVVSMTDTGGFQLGDGTTEGASISKPATGRFILTFTTPVATSTTVTRLTIQSSKGGQTLGPGGGEIFYYSAAGFNCGPNYTQTCNYLEVAPNLWNGVGSEQDPTFEFATPAYQSADVVGIGDFGGPDGGGVIVSQIGLGYKNSEAIVTQNGLYNASSNRYAAGVARAYRGGTKSDWYLPSVSEINLLCQWAKGIPQNATSVCRSLTAPTRLGEGFEFNFNLNVWDEITPYATSSEEDPAYAEWMWGFDMVEGEFTGDAKSTELRVRPIRAF